MPGGSAWRHCIVSAVTEAVGAAQVFLIGSRATGEALAWSDCDISVVLPSRKILTAGRRFPAVAAALSRNLGVPVSINPVPKFLFDRARHNLYLLKIRAEGVRLDADASAGADAMFAAPGCDTSPAPVVEEWNTCSPASHRAEISYLLSAVHGLLQGVEPHSMLQGSLDARAEAAVRKAQTQFAQSCLLSTGQYVASSAAAVTMATQLGLLPVGISGVAAFLDLQLRLSRALGPDPVPRSGLRAMGRDLQYVALSALRGHRRWSIPFRHRGIQGSLASASVRLLLSLSPDAPGGFHTDLVREATLLLPAALRTASPEYRAVRDVILSEWGSAQPLVGIVS